MSSCLIICHGFFGDHIFASSIAEHLIKERQFDTVDYLIGFPQVAPFFDRNPYVNDVHISGVPGPDQSRYHYANFSKFKSYDKTFQLTQLSFEVPPPIEFQIACGVQTPSSEYTIYTNPEYDLVYNEWISDLKKTDNRPVVAMMHNWQEKAFGVTPEEYAIGNNIPYLGYGGRLRNIPYIIEQLQEHCNIIEVGSPHKNPQFVHDNTIRTLDQEASLLKHCDYFIGAEGGLANVASGVGCKTILTSDFVHTLYGWNGCIKKIPEPKLGPRYYFKSGHIDLDPYLNDAEVANSIISIIQGT